MAWWNTSYLFKLPLTITNSSEPLSAGALVDLSFDTLGLYNNGKTRADYEDVEVIHVSSDATPVLTVLAREVTATHIRFFLSESLSLASTDAYYIYFGNWDLANRPSRPSYVENLWTTHKTHSDKSFAYTRPGDHWINGVSNHENAVATVPFFGSKFRAKMTVGPNMGLAQISIDDGAWADMDLYSATIESSILYTKTGLASTKHKARIKVLGRAIAASTDTKVGIDSIEYLTPLNVTVKSEEIYNVKWTSVMSGA